MGLMSIRLRDAIMRELPQLRHEPIDKRIRATLGGATVIDTTRALLIWEPPGGETEVAWYYPAPLREAAEVTGRVAFFNEKVDIDVDGSRLERPVTPWSKR
jgi:uncharacterized protein (DUF427 family)